VLCDCCSSTQYTKLGADWDALIFLCCP
jgi:hypothetical protein